MSKYTLLLCKVVFIVCCNAAALQIDYSAQCNALHLNFTFLHYRNAVVGTEAEIRPLQLTATQLQWLDKRSLSLGLKLRRSLCSQTNLFFFGDRDKLLYFVVLIWRIANPYSQRVCFTFTARKLAFI